MRLPHLYSRLFLCSLFLCLFNLVKPADGAEWSYRARPNAPPPTAFFTAQVRCETDSVYFSNQSTTGPDMVYAWDLGDGTLSQAIDPVHLYPITGNPSPYTVSLIATDTLAGTADTFSLVLTTYPVATGYISRDVPYDRDTLHDGVPILFRSNATGTTANVQYQWDFNNGTTSQAENPAPIFIDQIGPRVVELTILNGTCPFDTSETFEVIPGPRFLGGAMDGHGSASITTCPPSPIFVGGPYEGTHLGVLTACAADSIYTGGPFEGSDAGQDQACLPDSIYAGGPFDGADQGVDQACLPDSIYAGGPYDGTDPGVDQACIPDSIYAGGPYDGTDTGVDKACELDSIYAGGPYDGAGQGIDQGCALDSIFVGGSYDGADMDGEEHSPNLALHYRTRRNGIWTDVTVWQVYDTLTLTWIDAELYGQCNSISYPTSVNLTIQVLHDVAYDFTIPVGVDQVLISSTGHLTIPDTVTLLLVDGPGSNFPQGNNTLDLDNRGYFEITGTFDPSPGAILENDAPSIVHYNGGLQSMWNGQYGWLYVDGPGPIANNTKTLSGPTTYIRTGLNFINARIDLGPQDLEFHSNAQILNPGQTTGYLVATAAGFCVWNYPTGLNQSRLFPLGGSIYSPATLTFDAVTFPGTLLGRVREMQHPTRFTIFRYWTLEQGSMAFNGFYDGVFQYDHADLPTPPVTLADELAQVEVGGAYNPAYSAPNGWRLSPVDLLNTVDLLANTGTIRNDSFSDFTFMPPLTPLSTGPVVFNGRWEGQEGFLYWRAEEEEDLEGFVLERSLDGLNFDSLTYTSSTEIQRYSYLDQELASIPQDVFYYRLQTIDKEGETEYSNVVTLSRTPESQEEYLSVYPNPSHSGQAFNFTYFLLEGRKVKLDLYDMLGKKVWSINRPFSSGLNELEIPTQKLAVGTYHLRVTDRTGIKNKKVVVLE